MAQGLFTLKQQLQGLIQKAWSGRTPTTYSGAFNGSSNYLTVPNNTAFDITASDFTIEAWVFRTTSGTEQYLAIQRNDTPTSAGWGFEIYTSNVLRFYYTGVIAVTGSTTIPTNTWTYVTVTRSGTSVRLFVNGVLDTTTTVSNGSTSSTTLYIGASNAPGTLNFPGFISNFRLVKGTAVYTSTFTPPTAPLTAITNTSLLTLQNSTIIDNSSNAFAITNVGGVLPDNKNPFNTPNVSTSAVEYLVVAGGGGGGSGGYGGGGGGGGGLLQGITPITAGASITVTVGSGGAGGSSGGASSSGGNSVFGSITAIGGGGGASATPKNGSSGGSGGGGSSSTGIGAQGIFGQGNAGGNGAGTSYLGGGGGGGAGTVGLAAISSTIGGNGGAGIATAINGTVTAYAGGGGGGNEQAGTSGAGGVGGGTSGAQANAGSSSAAANTGGGAGGGGGSTQGSGGSGIVIISYPDIYNAPSAFGGANSPTASTSGSGSLSFNGSTQYIATADTTNVGSGSFTIEGWFYANTLASGQVLVDTYISASTNSWQVYVLSSHLRFYSAASGIAEIVGTATLSTNTWYHFAVVRSGTSVKTYLNGVLDGSGTDATNYNATGTLWIGGQKTSGPTSLLNGYESNVRIVVGTAVYTSAFTPPTAPLTAISGTQYLLGAVSGAPFADGSGNGYNPTNTTTPTWNQLSPFATGLGYKNRVYTFTGSGTVTF